MQFDFNLFINTMIPFIGIIIVLVCFVISCGGKPEPPMEVDPVDRLPPYLKKEYARTATQKQQRRYYSSESMSGYKRPISGVSRAIAKSDSYLGSWSKEAARTRLAVEARRGGEFIGNRMRFKVKVVNGTHFTITDVKVFLISYPTEALRIDSENDDVSFPKIEPQGFRSPTFDFLPTQDCVKGEIIAGVSYVDERGKAHTLTTKPFVIRSVCDLLIPDQIAPDEFELKLKEHECGEIVVKVQEWTAHEMYEKSLRIIEDANFYEVESSNDEQGGVFHGRIAGLARGKYTGK
ncbi:MAG: hypothetical protein ACTSPB_25620, partial [Candidatus Thorarchaeota archaeon]